jgi:hypothetical protein
MLVRTARMRRLLLGLGALAVILPPLHSGPAAAAGSTAMCFHQWNDTVTPGVTTSRMRAAVSSHGETGTIQCSGNVRGQQVTGPGTFGEVRPVTGDCVTTPITEIAVSRAGLLQS